MKTIFNAVLLAIALTASAAQANTYSFSYNFINGIAVTGLFDGTASGGLVTDISNVSVFVNGVKKAEPLSVHSLQGNSWENSGVASFDGFRNNFSFDSAFTVGDDGIPRGFTFSFLTVGYPDDIHVVGLLDFSLDPEHYLSTESSTLGGVQSRWHLQEVSAVPEPETYAMMLTGLGILGFAARRRKQA